MGTSSSPRAAGLCRNPRNPISAGNCKKSPISGSWVPPHSPAVPGWRLRERLGADRGTACRCSAPASVRRGVGYRVGRAGARQRAAARPTEARCAAAAPLTCAHPAPRVASDGPPPPSAGSVHRATYDGHRCTAWAGWRAGAAPSPPPRRRAARPCRRTPGSGSTRRQPRQRGPSGAHTAPSRRPRGRSARVVAMVGVRMGPGGGWGELWARGRWGLGSTGDSVTAPAFGC